MPQPEHVRDIARLAARVIRDVPDVDWTDLSNGEQLAMVEVPVVAGLDGRSKARVKLVILLDEEARAEEMVMPLLRIARGFDQ